MSLMRDWCPAFPKTCPFVVQPEQREICPFLAEDIHVCTLDRVCQPRPVINAIVLDTQGFYPDSRILLVHRGKTAVQAGMWAIPGGGIHTGETLDQAVIREVAEETGYSVRLIEPLSRQCAERVWLVQGTAIPFQVVQAEAPDDPHNFIGFFVYAYWDGETRPQAVNDLYTEEVAWFGRQDLQELIAHEQITPLDTVILERHILPQWDT